MSLIAIRIVKKIIKSPINITNYIINCTTLKLHDVKKGKNLHINGRLIVKGTNLSFGNNVRINSGKKYNIIGGDIQAAFVIRDNACIVIGNNVGISNSTFVAQEKIIVEDDVLFGGGCKIYDNDFHSVAYLHRMQKSDFSVQSRPIIIKRGAFIGAHVIILKGVTVGEKSVIGAGTVLTKNVPSHEIWAGNPACFIRKI